MYKYSIHSLEPLSWPFFLLPLCVWVGSKEIEVSVHLISTKNFELNIKIHLKTKVLVDVICFSLGTQMDLWLLFHGKVKQKPWIHLCWQAVQVCPVHGIYYVLSCSLQSPDLGNTLLLSSKHGQQYQCVLPQLENLEKKNDENQQITKDEIPQLLEPMKKKCLYNVSPYCVWCLS